MSTPGVLTHQDIVALCDFAGPNEPESRGHTGPVRPCRRANVRSASYDLRLGVEYHQQLDDERPSTEVKQLTPGRDEGIIVPPNGVVIVTILETLHLPKDMVGHLSLKVDVLMQGLIMANQSQIDAGYDGQIFALLYNLSGEPRTLKYTQSLLRLELVRLAEDTAAPYHGTYEGTDLAGALRRPVSSALAQMDVRVRRLSESIDRTQLVAGLVGIALAVASGLVYRDLDKDVGRLQGHTAEISAGRKEVAAAQATIRTLEEDVKQLQEQVRALERRVR